MYYSPHPPGPAAMAVVLEYTLMSEYPPRNERERLEEQFVLDFLVTIPQETSDH